MKTARTWWIGAIALLALSLNNSAIAQTNGLSNTALDEYVAAPDPHYKYEVVNTIEGDGVTTYIVDMTSQKWLTEKEVNEPIWKHWMTITAPYNVSNNIGMLLIGGGSIGRDAPGANDNDALVAKATNSVVTTLYQIPNQPLVFVADETIKRSEDAIIAYTWDKYLRTGDEKWPLRLPMTKGAVRAMDTITAVMAENGVDVNEFVVAGGSKRGWTTWTTAAVDKRVVAIMPIVIDMLNVVPSFQHHFEVYGRYANAVADYNVMGIMNWTGTEEYDALMDIVEPYEYRDRLNLPKYILNSTGDQFFLPDSWQFYWNDLVGEKHLRYVPNSDHGITDGTDAFASIVAWYDAIVNNVQMPRYTWSMDEEGEITVFTLDEPTEVLLWQAHNPESRSFMKDAIGTAYQSTPLEEVEPGKYVVKVDAPPSGFTAYFVEMHYPSGVETMPFKFSTGTKIVPDVVNHKWKKASKKERMKEPPHN